jgi:hypothetical protein
VRVLFDQGTPAPLRGALTAHVVVTAYEMGWSARSNGDLLGSRQVVASLRGEAAVDQQTVAGHER